MKPLPKVTLVDDAFYASQAKVYPREIKGIFTTLRAVAVYVLLGIFYLLPWARWDGRQAVLFDLPGRKFHMFALTFWPQDFFWLSWLLVIAGLSLFFFTALAGRLWCGYACPQTVYTEVFVWIERACEGRRNMRIKLDAAPWGMEKLLRKGSKYLIWLVFSAWTGLTFVGFFTPITTLFHDTATFSLSGWETFWALFYGLATYGNAGLLREQICKYMCPYARFQGAMFDKDTLIVSYDATRGEPRGARKHNADLKALGLGECVDCDACVQVCPTGIDIRDGLQIECIACAGCIDACDQVMDKMGYPRGLVGYTTENRRNDKSLHVLRLRTLIYGALLAFLLGTFVWGIAHRASLIVDVLRDRNALYRTASDGAIENSYTVNLANKTQTVQHVRFSLGDETRVTIVDAGTITLPAGEVTSVPLTLRSEHPNFTGMIDIKLIATDAGNGVTTTQTAPFYAPPESK